MANKNKWIQKAVNPKHKGYCTPMSKKTCTPARKAFAKRAKAGKLQTGGPELADFGQNDPHSVAGQFPTIDANYDPLNQMQSHAKPQHPILDTPSPGSFMKTNAGQKIQNRYASKYSPYVNGFNVAATAATDIGNAITGNKLKDQEYLQTVRSMTPKFMTNTNQGGLNNSPAYTMYGGDDRSFATMEMGGELDYMMVGGVTPGQYYYSNRSNEDYGYEGIAHNAFYGDQSIYATGGSVTSSKAKEILRDGTVHGKPLTDKQKRYFGWIAGGSKTQNGGRYQVGGPASMSPEQRAKYEAFVSKYENKNVNLNLPKIKPVLKGDDKLFNLENKQDVSGERFPSLNINKDLLKKGNTTLNANYWTGLTSDSITDPYINLNLGHDFGDNDNVQLSYNPRKANMYNPKVGLTYTHSFQTGGQTQLSQVTPTAPETNPSQYNPNNPLDKYYGANVTLQYYKEKLNSQLKTKNPQGYTDYFKQLQGARTKGTTEGQQYIQNANYNDYLTPDEVKKTLGDKDYENYLNNLKAVNQYNVSQGQQPLYGNIEGESNDPSKLNYGRRFASLQTTHQLENTIRGSSGDKKYSREYKYNPQTGQVEIAESGDNYARPSAFEAPVKNNSTTSRQYGGPRDIRNERESFSYYMGAKNGGYAVGDEVELSAAEISKLKKQGYKIKLVK